MRTLAIDIETYSSVSLKNSGVYAYTQAPDFTILLFGYAWDDGPVRVADLTKNGAKQLSLFDGMTGNVLDAIPADVLSALTDPRIIKTAFNANFERVCLTAFLGQYMDPRQWECTMVRAAEAGLPRSLERAGAALGLPQDKQKDAKGKRLIQYFCVPHKPTKRNSRTRNLPEHSAEKWQQFIEYNRQDVVAEREIRNMLPPIPEDEQRLWVIDQEINDRGVRVDRKLVDEMVVLGEELKAPLIEEAKAVTGLSNPNSRNQMLRWINEKTGNHYSTFRKDDYPRILAETTDPQVHRMIEIRQVLAKSSLTKYKAMQSARCADGRVRGLTAFYGAPRTGRFSGRIVQLQNLPRNYLNDLDSPRELIRAGEGAALPLLYEEPADVMSQLIRTALIPKAGCRFIVADFSAIEARVLAWLAKENWRLQVFESHGKIYEASASQMFAVPMERIVKGNPEYALRAKGKVAELALGYGGGGGPDGAMVKMGALEMGLTLDELPNLVAQWRSSNPNITAFWKSCEQCARKTLDLLPESPYHTAIETTGGRKIRFYHDSTGIRIQLPSGRSLYYRNAKIESRKKFGWDTWGIVYDGAGKEAKREATYGGKLAENITQAVARDCLAESMRRIDALGFQIVFHVHDEVILEVPIGMSSANEIADIMGQPIDWAPELPLNADAYECDYYKKD